MKIDAKQTIGGQPMKIARDFIRKLAIAEFTEPSAATMLSLSVREARNFIEGLRQGGFVEPAEHPGDFRTTVKGNALAMAKFIKRLDRSRAEQLLTDVLKRIREINERPELTHFVSCASLFGSYLSAEDTLGDVDIALTLEHRYPQGERIAANDRRVENSGLRLNGFLDRLFYGEREVRGLIKQRSPYVSLHPASDLEELAIPSKVIFKLSTEQVDVILALASRAVRSS